MLLYFLCLVKPVAGRTLELAKLGTEAIELEALYSERDSKNVSIRQKSFLF